MEIARACSGLGSPTRLAARPPIEAWSPHATLRPAPGPLGWLDTAAPMRDARPECGPFSTSFGSSLAGFWLALAYVLAGLILCITIIGIPFGVQSFKLAGYALWPFGRVLVPSPTRLKGLSVIANILWFILAGWWLALAHLLTGILLCHRYPPRRSRLQDGGCRPGSLRQGDRANHRPCPAHAGCDQRF